MTEHQALFITPMVQAILEGRKTQTRRVITPHNSMIDGQKVARKYWDQYRFDFDSESVLVDGGPSPAGNPGPYLHVPSMELGSRHRIYPDCWPGDLLWVRETWCRMDGEVIFRASVKHPETLKWKPSIYMPKSACRLWLKIKVVRVERIITTSREDARAEGVETDGVQWKNYFPGGTYNMNDPITSFFTLWDSINEKRGFGRDANPWVWVVEFEVDKSRSHV